MQKQLRVTCKSSSYFNNRLSEDVSLSLQQSTWKYATDARLGAKGVAPSVNLKHAPITGDMKWTRKYTVSILSIYSSYSHRGRWKRLWRNNKTRHAFCESCVTVTKRNWFKRHNVGQVMMKTEHDIFIMPFWMMQLLFILACVIPYLVGSHIKTYSYFCPYVTLVIMRNRAGWRRTCIVWKLPDDIRVSEAQSSTVVGPDLTGWMADISIREQYRNQSGWPNLKTAGGYMTICTYYPPCL